MKYTLKTVLVALIISAILYGISAFISLQPNPFLWTENGRAIFSIVNVLTALATGVIAFYSKD